MKYLMHLKKETASVNFIVIIYLNVYSVITIVRLILS